MIPDSFTLIWMFVLATLASGGALLVGERFSPNARSGLMLAFSGTWLAIVSLVVTAAVAYYGPLLLS